MIEDSRIEHEWHLRNRIHAEAEVDRRLLDGDVESAFRLFSVESCLSKLGFKRETAMQVRLILLTLLLFLAVNPIALAQDYREYQNKDVAPESFEDLQQGLSRQPSRIYGGRASVDCSYRGPDGTYSNEVKIEARWVENALPGSDQNVLHEIIGFNSEATKPYVSVSRQSVVLVTIRKPNANDKRIPITQARVESLARAILARIEARSRPWPEVYRRAQIPLTLGPYALKHFAHTEKDISETFSYNHLRVVYAHPYEGESLPEYYIHVVWSDPQDPSPYTEGKLSAAGLAASSNAKPEITHVHASKLIASAHYDSDAKELEQKGKLPKSQRDKFDELSRQLIDRLAPLAVDHPDPSVAANLLPSRSDSPPSDPGRSLLPTLLGSGSSGSDLNGEDKRTRDSTTTAAVAIALILIGAAVGQNLTQAIATAIADATRAGLQSATDDAVDAIIVSTTPKPVVGTRTIILSGDEARDALRRGVGANLPVPEGDQYDLDLSSEGQRYRDGYRGNRGRVAGIGAILTDENGNLTISVDVEFEQPASNAPVKVVEPEIIEPTPEPAPTPTPDPIPEPEPESKPTPPPIPKPVVTITEPKVPEEPQPPPPNTIPPKVPPPKTIPDLEDDLDKAKKAAWRADWRMWFWGWGLLATDGSTKFVDWTFGLASAFTGPGPGKMLDAGYGTLRSLGKWVGRSLVDGKWSDNAKQVGSEFAADQAFNALLGKWLDKLGATPANFGDPGPSARAFWDALKERPEVGGQLGEQFVKKVTGQLAEWGVRDPAKEKIGLTKWNP